MQPSWNEADRLAALRAYDILDSAATAEFEDFVRIVSLVCEAPIAVVNLIDEARQWFAAEIGLGIRETPRDVSICAHAILQPGILVVPDLAQDPRFAGNTLITGEPRLRFYAGALLETPDGLPLGTLCVLDHAPRPQGLTAMQRFTLQALARQVMTQLSLRRAMAEKELLLQEAHHRVKNNLQMVQSLLTLQARATSDPEAAQQLRASAGRVSTFGLMHEHLYQEGASLDTNLKDYLAVLLTDQAQGLAATQPEREIRLEASPLRWPTSDAARVGLVMVELVTNALKHGSGTIHVDLRQAGEDAVLTVEDEGQGLPPAMTRRAAGASGCAWSTACCRRGAGGWRSTPRAAIPASSPPSPARRPERAGLARRGLRSRRLRDTAPGH